MLYAAPGEDAGGYQGTNGGVTAGDWSRVDTAGSEAASVFPNARISSIRIDPNDTDRVWLTFTGNG